MERQISILQLSVLMSASTGIGAYDMHYNGPSPYVRQGPNNETYRIQCTHLLDCGMITKNWEGNYPYKITDKGRFYLEHLLSTPFPIEEKSWVIPK